MENIMIIKKIKELKKVSYFCLTLLSTLAPLAAGANEALSEDKKYNVIGIALFSGSDRVSQRIKSWTHSTVSHVGIILADQNNENEWHCFQSTGSKGEVLNGQYPHVRLNNWEEVVEEYEGTVQYRLFVFQNENRTNPEWVTGFVRDYNGKFYTKNPFKLLKALFRRNGRSKSPVLKRPFCSELVAQMLMDLRIAPLGIAGNYLPKDFSSEVQLRLEKGIELTPEFRAPKSEFLNRRE
jgi:hypothetical protein